MPTDPRPEMLTIRIYELASESLRQEDFAAAALELCHREMSWKGVVLARAEGGTWQTWATAGSPRTPPEELLGESLDRDSSMRAGTWLIVPLTGRDRSTNVLCVDAGQPIDAASESIVNQLAKVLSQTLNAVADRLRLQSRVKRLEAILAIASDWTGTLEMDDLLERMAQASTQLLDAERASIFLRDRHTKTVVGRPALGVTSGELRIPDDKGVVGQVLQSGQPRRVGTKDEHREIDHSVDKQLGFRTRSLLCVPLRGKNDSILGAFELLNKRHGDFTADDETALVELAAHAAIALENSLKHEQVVRSRNHVASQAASRVQLIGESPAIVKLRQTITRVAATDLAVLILGENGTGKDVVAQMIHYQSSRRNEPFVAVNCAALPDTLLESELFGHEKGAFTDARETRQGKFELAAGGTLLLDEIGDMSLNGQAKLLRVLEEKVVVRVGGALPIHTDARIIAATNQNLAELVAAKKFRQDLLFRLTVVTLELPPLRERGEDVLLLAEYFLQEYSLKARRAPLQLAPDARRRLLNHHWQGNIRELRNLMERLAFLCPSDVIEPGDLSFVLSAPPQSSSLVSSDLPLAEATRQFQIEFIQRHIDRARGNMTEAAEQLGLHRSNLYRKMNQLGMGPEEQPDQDS